MQTQHELPRLPYGYGALEPHIDEPTMRLHHEKHHATYVESLNKALEDLPELQERSAPWLLLNPDSVPEALRVTVANNAGGHVNHRLFWRSMRPEGGGSPTGTLGEAISRDFGSYEKFKSQFEEAGAALFGSGWVWLARANKDGGKLKVYTTAGHENPLMHGHFPLLVNDVWEHAYYLKYANRRADYLKGWWAIANWEEAARRFERSDHGAEPEWEDDGGSVLATVA